MAKKKQKQVVYAFIDSQNVNLAIKSLGWTLDWRKFRVYLAEHYKVEQAYIFIGFILKNQDLYSSLQKAGFILVFKPIMTLKDGTVKGNVDAELVLHTMIEYPNYTKAVIITGDGDFRCLVDYLYEKDKLLSLLAPNKKNSSKLLKYAAHEKIAYMNYLKNKLKYNRNK
jgi:uncharacterized LabA/DUF88 family protein